MNLPLPTSGLNIPRSVTPQAHQPTRIPSLPSIQERLNKIQKARSAAQEAMHKEQDRLTKPKRHHQYQEGQKVWLEGTNLKLPYETAKLAPKRYGPFKVVAKIAETSYQLELPRGWKIHPVFHTSLLTPYNETNTHGPNFLEPPPDIIEGEPEWEVEKILSECTYRNKQQYLVRWKDYSPAHDSWVDKADIHVPELIKQYCQDHPHISQPQQSLTNPPRRISQHTKKLTKQTHINTSSLIDDNSTLEDES